MPLLVFWSVITQLPIWLSSGSCWSQHSTPLGHEHRLGTLAGDTEVVSSGHAQQEMAPWGQRVLAGKGWEGAMGNFAPSLRAAVPAGDPTGALQAPSMQALLAQAHCGPCTGREAALANSPARVRAMRPAPAEADGAGSGGTCPPANLHTTGWVVCAARRLRLQANAEITQFLN